MTVLTGDPRGPIGGLGGRLVRHFRGHTFQAPTFTVTPLGNGRIRLESTAGNTDQNDWTAADVPDGIHLDAQGTTAEIDLPYPGDWWIELETDGVMGYFIASMTITVTEEMMSPDYGWTSTLEPALDPLTGPRRDETWQIDVLTRDEEPLGDLDGVTAGSLDYSIHTEIRSSGSLTVNRPGDTDWHQVRLAIRYEYVDGNGDRHTYPLGVFLPTTPTTRHTATGPVAEVELYDKMVLLTRGGVAETWTAAAGTTIAQAVTDVLATVGEQDRVLAPDDGGGTLTAAMVWEPGTTKLRIVNDILAAGNFFSIWVDGEGMWRLDPYVPPASRGIEWTHIEGPTAIFTAEVSHESDAFNVPNQVVIVGRVEDDNDPTPFAVAENNDPDDPLSIPNVGPITLREDEQDATSETVLQQIADRRLAEVSQVTSTYEITHAYIPIDLNAAVRLVMPSVGVDALCVFQKWSWSWDAESVPGLVAATLREVQA